MATMEMDPVFSRALRLMHSKSKDAGDQLRAMLEEAIKQRYGTSKSLGNLYIKKEVTGKKEGSKSSSSSSGRKDGDKKTFDKMDDNGDTSHEVSPSKRSKSSEITKSGMGKSLITTVSSSSVQLIPHESDDLLKQDEDDDDLALEILEEDLTCVVCRGMDVVARNQLVECVECHSLYHQECHQPPVPDADMNDPRSAWYCSTCTKKIQGASKQALAGGRVSPYTTPTGGTGGKPSFSVTSKSNSSPTFSSTSKSFGGISVQGTKSSSSSKATASSSASASSKVVVPNINIISADKRLQIMKKKAAKMQEKRKHSK